MHTLINAVNAGHGGKWAHAKGYIRRLIREILKKVMRRQKRTRGSTTHVPTTVKEYAVILKKSPSSRFHMHENLVLLAIWMIAGG